MMNRKLARRAACAILSLFMVLSLTGCGGPSTSATSDESAQISGSGALDTGSQTSGSGSGADPEAKTPKEIMDEMLVKTLAIYEKNDDTVGWLYIENTSIDESVVQAPDNDFYLRRNNLKQSSFNGCYYLDFRAKTGKRTDLSKNTVIYGHSMDDNPDGGRFSQLKKYLDLDYCKEHQFIYYTTPEGADMVWQIFAVFYTDISFNYINPNPDNTEYLNIITQARSRSQFNFDVDVGVSDHILTLSTCTYTNTANRSNYRYVVMAKLLPAGDTGTLASVAANPTPYSA